MVNGGVTSEFELNALEKQDISCGYRWRDFWIWIK